MHPPYAGAAVRVLTAAVLALSLAAFAPLAEAPADARPTSAPRLLDVSIPAVHGPIADEWLPGYSGGPRAKVLLPAGYDPHKKYPLLVLLIGLTSTYHSWSDPGLGQIAKTAAGLDAIIVMPEAGNGWYADWWNKGERGSPSWETYILDDVIGYATSHYPIRPGRRWHALAGVSMGGLGTAYLGGRLPGFFGSIAVLSGLVNTQLIFGQGSVMAFIPQYLAKTKIDPVALYGPETGFYFRGHDPMRLAANLAHTRIFLTVGDGIPTEDGQPHHDQSTDGLAEGAIIRPAMLTYAAALRHAGVAYTLQQHHGSHSWPNFRTELKAAIAWNLFAPVVTDPTSWVNDTVATSGSLWGFGYTFSTPPTKIVRFARHGASLSVSAAGSAVTLRTPHGCTIRTATPVTITVRPGC
ncbi:MAG TPA: alpha/beta hydrolase-fold protein [Marmoricola sp.]|jgi:S-formylglutathione hydrolase FrmB|nr:alpha/beta hydrolase-fold protein [Marmoricola sp.]